MEFKHTPGEWRCSGLQIRSESGMILINTYSHLQSNQSRTEAEANTKLIAAAPKLLQGLIEARHMLRSAGYETNSVGIKGIDSLIKEATE